MFENMHPLMATFVAIGWLLIFGVILSVVANIVFGAYFRQKVKYMHGLIEPLKGVRHGKRPKTRKPGPE